jgi:DNA-binding PadR family transcriptional regulator
MAEHSSSSPSLRGKRRTKIFSQNELSLLVLLLLKLEPNHGYGLIKALSGFTQETYVPSSGVIYPVLSLLQEQEFIAEHTEDAGRKTFHLTDAGQQFMQARTELMRTIREKIQLMVMAKRPQRISAIEEAFDVLKISLRTKVNEKPLTEKQVEKIKAAIIAAALKIKQI